MRNCCAACHKRERPWRKMLWYPLGGVPSGLYVCSDKCWDAIDNARFGKED